ncbi:iron chelate uptake ABC transporter family permease subunit [Ascidiaceihabitans sp.]|uniref:FecCD family ABC transporter permease n=1 Tax=Ascidiaceihabitans sp. TaxID=1872644 RepID=UPI003296DC84
MNRVIRIGPVSVQVSRRAGLMTFLIGLGMIFACVIALRAGSFPMNTQDVLAALTGDSDPMHTLVVYDLRLPRILAALGAGAAFGIAGAMFQTMLRNPLASPDIIGFNAGASCGALFAMVTCGGFVLLGAMIGGALAAMLVLVLSWQNGLHPYRLILIGIGVSLTLSAFADLLITRMDALTAADMAKWLIGTLNARSWADVIRVTVGLGLLLPLIIWLNFVLTRLSLSDETATGLGLAVSLLRLTITAAGVALVALAISVAGPLPFVAFVSGPIARRLVGRGKPALLAAGGIGALVTLLADTASRLIPFVSLPTGVFTAIIGAPVLMWLLLVQARKGNII